MDKNTILTIANQYAHAVKADPLLNSYINDVYLFGSYAKGTAKKKSDIDIAVILNGKNKMDAKQFFQISGNLLEIVCKVDERIEPILIDPDDDEMEFYQEIRETGIRINQ